MKVLVSSYSCEPGRGSEEGIGWNWIRQIARFHDTWVITRTANRDAIERALTQHAIPRVRWEYYDLPRSLTFWKNGNRGLFAYYYLWQLAIYQVGRRLHSAIGFDLTHHVTFGQYWTPSLLALLNVPFVWGPLGGADAAPQKLRRGLSWKSRFQEGLRDVMRMVGEHDPFVRIAARRTTLALAATPKTAERLLVLGCARVEMEACVGMTAGDCEAIAQLPAAKAAGCFRAISIGNLLCWKGFDLGIAAFAQLASKRPQAEYWILGDGPERLRLEAMAARLGIKNSVRFFARVSRQEVLSRLAQCDVLIHPSSHDSGPWVSLEAMAAALPVICLDLGGISSQVDAATGFRLPVGNRDTTVRQIAKALSELAENSELKRSLGQAGQARVKASFNWNDKGTQLARRYRDVTSVTRPRPDPAVYGARL